MWFKIQNGVVREQIPSYATPPSEWYPPSFVKECVFTEDASIHVGMWYSFETGEFYAENPNPETSTEESSEDIWAELAAAIDEGVNGI